MVFIQMTGLSGAGKTTIAQKVQIALQNAGYKTEILDGDVFRQNVCKDLGFSKADRCENIRRMGFVASLLVKNGVITIMAAINPYEEIRQELAEKYGAKTVWINCDIETLKQRDTKGLYQRAFLPDEHPDKIKNLTGVNDTYEIPQNPDLMINTKESIEESVVKVLGFIRTTGFQPV